jgi:hypothetical protein
MVICYHKDFERRLRMTFPPCLIDSLPREAVEDIPVEWGAVFSSRPSAVASGRVGRPARPNSFSAMARLRRAMFIAIATNGERGGGRLGCCG